MILLTKSGRLRFALWTLVVVGLVASAVQIEGWRKAVIARAEQLHTSTLNLEVRRIGLSKELHTFGQNPAEPFLWKEDERGVANARIQAHISEAATRNGLALRSISPAGNGTLGDRQTAIFRLEAEARLDHLSAFLRGLEYDLPAVLVDGAVLRRLNRPGSTSEQPELFVQMDLVAPISIQSNEATE
ncbi:MAG: GspMb/PilO family protein [Tateyamaria sp.]|uniref:GspMb/PilO family protein n=1 Tax=Tateyamaria sp. TaxID=1929288 RepID=UPI00329C9A57